MTPIYRRPNPGNPPIYVFSPLVMLHDPTSSCDLYVTCLYPMKVALVRLLDAVQALSVHPDSVVDGIAL